MTYATTLSSRDLLAVRSRVSWGAIAAGAMVALASYFVLTLLGLALGMELFMRGQGGLEPGAAIYSIVVLLPAMFLGGWAASRLAVGESKLEAVLHGTILWGVLFAGLFWLIGNGVRVGFGALVGTTTGPFAPDAGTNRLAAASRSYTVEDLKQAGLDEEQARKVKDYVERFRAEPGATVRQGAGRPDVQRATRQAAWWSLIGVLVSLATAIVGALTGAGELDRTMRGGTLLRSSGAGAGPRVLLVFLPGLAVKQARYAKLLSLLVGEDFLGNCDLLRFAFDNGYASTECPADVARRLTAEIEAHHRERGYEAILIIGQSLGALIARQAILDGHRSGHEWVTCRVRMALLADSNRGFIPRDITQKAGTWLLSTRLESIFGRPLPRWGDLASNSLRGSPWVTGLRLGWIRHFAEEGAPEPPGTIQVRGLCDRVVADDDSEDVNRIDNSELITVPDVGHEDIVTVSGPDDPLYRLLRDNIARILREDGTGKEKLRAYARGGADLLIFLVHGIRDFAEWQNAIEFQVRRRSEGRTVKVVPVQYGFFTLLQFLLPSQRDRAVRVFIDRYVQEVIKSPNAKVVVAAHSNGTYVVGKALERCDFLKAERVYFAGSVLSSYFPWDRLIGTQVGAVRNDCAKWDVPVGVICSALGSLPVYRDLGTAGYRGFRGAGVRAGLTNNLSIDGGHGAALRPQNRDEVADYLLTGRRASPETLIGESPLMRRLSAVAPLFLWLVVAVLGLAIPLALSFGLTGWVAVYASMAYALLVLWLLMRL